MEHAFVQEETGEKYAEADALTDQGVNGSTSDSHMEQKDKYGVQSNVKDAPKGDSDHGQRCLPLRTEEIVQDKGAAHHWGAQKNITGIVLGIGQNRSRRPQGMH